jgi:6-phosphogluconolactonase
MDKLFVYRLEQNTGALEPGNPAGISLPPGAAPRHFAFHPSGCHGHALNERDSTITAFCYDIARGTLQQVQVISTLPSDFCGDNATAEIELDEEGRYLYASNRGADNIAVFSVGPRASLQLIEHVPVQGRTPRHFAIDPSGDYLMVANQDTDNIVLFRKDPSTGRLTPTGQQHDVGAPACLVFVPRL